VSCSCSPLAELGRAGLLGPVGFDGAEQRTLTIPDSGDPVSWFVGSGGGSPWGWEVQLVVTPGAGMRLTGILSVDGWWQPATQLRIEGWDLNRGGRLLVPWPRFTLSVVDALAGGLGATSELAGWALARCAGDPPLGSSVLHGRTTTTVAKSSSSAVAVPSGATSYRVIPGFDVSGPIGVLVRDTPGGGAAEDWESFTIDGNADVSSGGGPLAGWGEVPPLLTPQILLSNFDPINDADVTVLWRFDLRSSR
jgi:hypothetical protein